MLTARKTAEPQAEISKETASPEGNEGGARKTEPATPRELQELFRRIEGEYPRNARPKPHRVSGRAIVGTRPQHMRIRPGETGRTRGPDARNGWRVRSRVAWMMALAIGARASRTVVTSPESEIEPTLIRRHHKMRK